MPSAPELEAYDGWLDAAIEGTWLNPQGIREAWNLKLGDPRTVIAIIESGIGLDHPDLVDRVWENLVGDLTDLANFTGPDYVDVPDTDGPEGTFGHGTHVAGIAAATFDNATGLAGVAANASIMPIRVMDDDGRGRVSDVANAVTWAATNGAEA